MTSRFRSVVLALMVAAAAPAAPAQILTYDNSNYLEWLQQLDYAYKQFDQLKQQLQAQTQMLAALGSDITGPIMQAVGQTQGLIGTITNAEQQGTALYTTLNTLFTSDFGGRTPAQIAAAMNQVNNILRTNQLAANAVQNQVVANQKITQQQISAGVTASNAATGQTAALQATNQLLAAISTQLGDMQSLLITVSKTLSDQALAKATAAQAGAASTGNDTESYTPSFTYSGVPSE